MLFQLVYRVALPIGRAHVWCLDHWRQGRGTTSTLALLAWALLRPVYVALYRLLLKLAPA